MEEFFRREFPELSMTKALFAIIDNYNTMKKKNNVSARLARVQYLNDEMTVDMRLATISRNFMQKINNMCLLSFPVESIYDYYKKRKRSIAAAEKCKRMKQRILSIVDLEDMKALYNQIQLLKGLRYNERKVYSPNDLMLMNWFEIDEQYRQCYERDLQGVKLRRTDVKQFQKQDRLEYKA